MIEGVQTKQLKIIPDERGRLFEILRNDDEMFTEFGQVYLTTNYPGVVKAWHYHKSQRHDAVCCVSGMIKLVLYDNREESPTYGEVNEFFIGEHNMMIVSIPQYVCHGWKGISEQESMVLSVVSEPYNHEDPDEYRLPYDTDEIPYDWERKNR
ncbi:MAG: dTDP-4-dehydrorhamnose 3,5-epimerase family protein [Candidatus Marinimicrobia bacterium]|nr:dTDP-4-dehydrorhamnose 3,5-epimerase family protein [Candidatus Neomarinimicrobiota bacterium]MCF7828564.1 dTDP-4-dehydrorhamnose 3,5-epimerase family protein [Candidatus Neomarinimicrobiota bacterium]MCF7880305.1 dTDP-4-dehydrorhamnose 3,5-epimerase family protein [Candidatus Neomarinimicrobiota bacterium]